MPTVHRLLTDMTEFGVVRQVDDGPGVEIVCTGSCWAK